ncbi:hypothetical protein PoB_006198300 [Plakobranchus ocellatus]|uniref:Uncharacterized protein n=1 Tax=Plakobranchus ocellatus TaxID=259542 RepID=A0AAV4CUC6_9GAST|nr:hypothetical protein PoB_006198300 [Plakobranchus ocellatus]
MICSDFVTNSNEALTHPSHAPAPPPPPVTLQSHPNVCVPVEACRREPLVVSPTHHEGAALARFVQDVEQVGWRVKVRGEELTHSAREVSEGVQGQAMLDALESPLASGGIMSLWKKGMGR